MSTKKVKPNSEKPTYAVTAQERTAINKLLARKAANPAPRLKVLKEKATSISPDHPNDLAGQALLMDAVGTADFDFYRGLIDQLASFCRETPRLNGGYPSYLDGLGTNWQ
jgi:hypothetical protein